jgi:hypothetical protein
MSTSLLIIGIVIGGIATLVSIIFTIISLATGKNQNAGAWAIGFVISITILILSAYQMIIRVGEKVKSGVEWLEEQNNNKDKSKDYDADDTSYARQERQDFLDTLKKYVNPSFADKVPADFYDNKAPQTREEEIVVPFLYPLSIRYNTNEFSGDIISDVNDSVFLANVTQMAFDENFAIAKVDNSSDKALLKAGRGEIEYILFDLRTREYLDFVSYEQLLDKSNKIGYTGPASMTNLSVLYRGWTDPLTFDF